MKIRALSNMPYASAKVHEYRKQDDDIQNMDILVSYKTPVVSIDYDTHLVVCYGLYTRTTIRHISSLMREKGMNYYIAKACYIHDWMYDFIEKKFLSRPV